MSDNDEPVSKRLRRRTVKCEPAKTQNKTSAKVGAKKRSTSRPLKSVENVPPNEQLNEPGTSQQARSVENISINPFLRLNETCLQKVFERFDVDSLCQMANVCKAFRKMSELVFGECHTKYKIDRSYKRSTFRRVLYKYGQLIKSIDTSEAYLEGKDGIELNAVVKYCGTNLETLYLNDAEIDCKVVKPLFARLKNLGLTMCDFTGDANGLFQSCSQLETLFFDPKESCRFLVRKYPKLEGLAFDCGLASGFTVIFGLLQQNQQLKYLELMAQSDDIFIASIVANTKNLEPLKIRPGMMSSLPERQTRSVFLQLSKLKNLKKLAIDSSWETYAKLLGPLVDAFAKEKVPLEDLDVRDFEITSKDVKSIQSIKTMKELVLHRIVRATEKDLVELTVKLPLLSNLQLYFDTSKKTPMTINGLIKMVKTGEQLDYIALVGVCNMKINEKIYKDLLKAVQDRKEKKKIIIDIFGCPSTCGFDVPENLLSANIHQLKIKYEEEGEECGCNVCTE